MFKILEKSILGPQINFLLVDAPIIAKKAQAGQFVMVRVTNKGERIPLTIADYNRQKGTISLVFQVMGKTTIDLAALNVGDFIQDILGPQGMPTEIENYGNVLVIGGGIGIAPCFPIATALKKAGNKVTTIIGYRSADYVFWEDKMRNASTDLVICTNDGSYGKKGFVTTALEEIIASGEKIDHVFCIGPAVMMKAVAEITKRDQLPLTVSLNALMVCGMGMCGACRISFDQATKFVCMDGPDFNGNKVDFNELIKRLEIYKPEECSCK